MVTPNIIRWDVESGGLEGHQPCGREPQDVDKIRINWMFTVGVMHMDENSKVLLRLHGVTDKRTCRV